MLLIDFYEVLENTRKVALTYLLVRRPQLQPINIHGKSNPKKKHSHSQVSSDFL